MKCDVNLERSARAHKSIRMRRENARCAGRSHRGKTRLGKIIPTHMAKKSLTEKFAQLYICCQKGGTSAMAAKKKKATTKKSSQRSRPRRRSNSLSRRTRGSHDRHPWSDSQNTHSVLASGSNLGLETKKKASQPRRKLSFCCCPSPLSRVPCENTARAVSAP